MFSNLTAEDKRQLVLKLQKERAGLKSENKKSKVKSSKVKKPKESKPTFVNPDVQAIFEKLPADFQKYLKGR